MPECRCNDIRMLSDAEADDYTAHLVEETSQRDQEGERMRYRCPKTGRKWVTEFLTGADGAMSMRLRQLMTAGELVQWLAAAEERASALDWTHPEVEFRPPDSRDTYHGIEEAERWAAKVAADESFPASRAISVVEMGDERALVLGELVYRRDNRYVERRPSAWLVAQRDGRVAQSLWFGSWEDGRRAAGLPSRGALAMKRVGRWALAVATPPSARLGDLGLL